MWTLEHVMRTGPFCWATERETISVFCCCCGCQNVTFFFFTARDNSHIAVSKSGDVRPENPSHVDTVRPENPSHVDTVRPENPSPVDTVRPENPSPVDTVRPGNPSQVHVPRFPPLSLSRSASTGCRHGHGQRTTSRVTADEVSDRTTHT